MKKGFTLAETLIALAIIGIVAALTIPALIAKYKKQITVTRMEKFYSTMNQAVKFAIADNFGTGDFTVIPNVKTPHNAQAMEDWWNTYFRKYVKSNVVEEKNNGIIVALSDGSGLGIVASGNPTDPTKPCNSAAECIHVVFCTEYKYCKNSNNLLNLYTLTETDGKNTFMFHFNSLGLSTYAVGLDRDADDYRDELKNNCSTGSKVNCAALIEKDNWEIKDDYPVKF